MYPLLQFFWELSLLRRAPQDLPASPTLLMLAVVAKVLVGTLGTAASLGGPGTALAASLFDAAVIGVLLYGTLRFAGRAARFAQTATAVFAIGTLFQLAILFSFLLWGSLQNEVLAWFVAWGLFAWAHVAAGHVLRHALEMELWAGIAIAFGFTLIGFVLVTHYFPMVAVESS